MRSSHRTPKRTQPATSALTRKTNMDQAFLEMKLREFQRICESLGIDIEQHHELIVDMFWDGFQPAEVEEAIEVLDIDGEFSHLKEHPYA